MNVPIENWHMCSATRSHDWTVVTAHRSLFHQQKGTLMNLHHSHRTMLLNGRGYIRISRERPGRWRWVVYNVQLIHRDNGDVIHVIGDQVASGYNTNRLFASMNARIIVERLARPS